jgi:hypothetical protein
LRNPGRTEDDLDPGTYQLFLVTVVS